MGLDLELKRKRVGLAHPLKHESQRVRNTYLTGVAFVLAEEGILAGGAEELGRQYLQDLAARLSLEGDLELISENVADAGSPLLDLVVPVLDCLGWKYSLVFDLYCAAGACGPLPPREATVDGLLARLGLRGVESEALKAVANGMACGDEAQVAEGLQEAHQFALELPRLLLDYFCESAAVDSSAPRALEKIRRAAGQGVPAAQELLALPELQFNGLIYQSAQQARAEEEKLEQKKTREAERLADQERKERKENERAEREKRQEADRLRREEEARKREVERVEQERLAEIEARTCNGTVYKTVEKAQRMRLRRRVGLGGGLAILIFPLCAFMTWRENYGAFARICATSWLLFCLAILFAGGSNKKTTPAPVLNATPAATGVRDAGESAAGAPAASPEVTTAGEAPIQEAKLVGTWRAKQKNFLAMSVTRVPTGLAVSLGVEDKPCIGGIGGVGTFSGDLLTIVSNNKKDSVTCKLRITFSGDTAQIEEEECSHWHGAACGFTGTLYKESGGEGARPVVKAENPAPAAAEPAKSPEPVASPGPISPSFDCRKAQTRAEKMICSDQVLAASDLELSHVYKAALNASADRKSLVSQQRAWLKGNRDNSPNPGVLLQRYRARIEELSR
jgi:hypothetical protein